MFTNYFPKFIHQVAKNEQPKSISLSGECIFIKNVFDWQFSCELQIMKTLTLNRNGFLQIYFCHYVSLLETTLCNQK